MVELNEWIDLPPESKRKTSSQLQQSDSMLLGVVTELVDAQNVAVAIDGVGDAAPDVVCPGSGRMWVGARVRCIRDSSGRVVRVEAMAVDELPDGVETQDMDATTQWISWEQAQLDARQGATADALDDARSDLDATQAQLDDPVTGLDAAQAKADDAAASAALAQGSIPFIQQATPSAVVVGQLWFPTDPSGRVIGMKVSTATGTGGWQDYRLMAGQILVPGTVGTTEIGPDGVTAPNIKASSELSAKIASFLEVTTGMLTAGGAKITGELLADILKVLTRIVAGNPDGTAAELDPFGLHVYRTLLDGTRAEVARFGTDTSDDYLGVLDSTGNTLASIDDEGGAAFQGVDAGDSLIYQGEEIGDLIALGPQGVIAMTGDFPNLANVTTTYGLVEIAFEAPADGVRVYRVAATFPVRQYGDTIRISARYTLDGTSPNVASDFFAQQDTPATSSDTLYQATFETIVRLDLAAGQQVRILLTVARASGTSNFAVINSQNPRFWVEDLGADADFGGVQNSGGGALPGSSSPTPPATTDPKRTYTKTYLPTWAQSYRLDGSVTTGMDPYAVQGYGGGPARMSMIGFMSVVGDLSGADVKKVEVYLQFPHWYQNSGGTAGIGWHGSTSKPSTWGGTTANIQRANIPKGGGVWVTLPSSTYAQWKSGGIRGITLRAPGDSTSTIYYGYADAGKARLRVTYAK